MVKRRYFVGWVLAALLVALNISAVGASVPDAANPNLPVAVGAGAGITPDGRIPNGGTAGLTRSTIQNPMYVGTQTNVSAIPSNNPNETAALYRPGGTYAVFWEETQARTVTTPRYSFFNGGTSTLGGAALNFTTQSGVFRIAGTASYPSFSVVYLGSNGPPGVGPGSTLQVNSPILLPTGQVISPNTALTVTAATFIPAGQGLSAGTYVVGGNATLLNQATGANVATLPMGSVIQVSAQQTQVRDSNGVAIYDAVLVRPVTFNPPNGTTTGEPTAADIVTPFTTSGKVTVFFPYTNNQVFGTSGSINTLGGNLGGFTTNPGQTRP